MKECPICRQVFADGNLRFCRYDGTPLVKAAPPDEALTMRLLKARRKRPLKGT
jgi:hypothetical protein